MVWFLTWTVAVELFGLGALPLAVRLFRRLPDRGYIFSKALGILLVGYIAWLLGAFGVLRFQPGTIAAILVILAVVLWARWGRETAAELRSGLAQVVVMELLFLLFFAVAAWIRAYNPQISGTEKPMDMAFLASLYRGDTLPPQDPWMSGFSISYYYFGYLLLAMIGKLSAVPAAATYNLGVALVYALMLAGSYSLVYNIVSTVVPAWDRRVRAAASLAGPIMVGIMGNLEIGVEILAARGIGGASFWNWVGVKGVEAAASPSGWLSTNFWWWWRASRVIPTIKPDGIDEFPFFSYLLGDLHPHFTALPWVMLTLALALSTLLSRAVEDEENSLDQRIRLLVTAVILGFPVVGNSWDFPGYAGVYWLAWLVPLSAADWDRTLMLRRARALVVVSVGSLVIYAPFMLGFSSQLKGIGVSTDKTPLGSMLILFGTFLVVAIGFLTWRTLSGKPSADSARVASARRMLAAVGGVLIIAAWWLGAVALLLGILVLAAAAVYRMMESVEEADWTARGAKSFLLILIAVGLFLILLPEFLFLVDLFGTRMNTVFKFHYEAWLMLGLAAAAATVWGAGAMRPYWLRLAAVVPVVLLVVVGLVYPVAAIWDKTQGFQSQPTLDGAAFYRALRPDDYAAIQWLSQSAPGGAVVLEATGGEYSEYARVSTFSGVPSVLGWAGHEVQWRGKGEEPQRRTSDIDAIYRAAERSSVRGLLDRYHVDYIFVGGLEVEKYGPEVRERFEGLFSPVFRQGMTTVYRVPR